VSIVTTDSELVAIPAISQEISARNPRLTAAAKARYIPGMPLNFLNSKSPAIQ
jgi:hypothetical protein